jgi:hypothetical protein
LIDTAFLLSLDLQFGHSIVAIVFCVFCSNELASVLLTLLHLSCVCCGFVVAVYCERSSFVFLICYYLFSLYFLDSLLLFLQYFYSVLMFYKLFVYKGVLLWGRIAVKIDDVFPSDSEWMMPFGDSSCATLGHVYMAIKVKKKKKKKKKICTSTNKQRCKLNLV